MWSFNVRLATKTHTVLWCMRIGVCVCVHTRNNDADFSLFELGRLDTSLFSFLSPHQTHTHTHGWTGCVCFLVEWRCHGSPRKARSAFSLGDPYFLLPGWPGAIWVSDWLRTRRSLLRRASAGRPAGYLSLLRIIEPKSLTIKPAESQRF